MKITKQLPFLLTVLLMTAISFSSCGQATSAEPWTANQLMPPSELAKMINDKNASQPVVLCIGPGAVIKGSIDIGPAQEKENLAKLKEQLSKLPKDANIVIYCGCCPFAHCPNVRPAFQMLKDMKFTNQKLLNLSTNIKTDWIDKGYPVAKK
ncbi:rhodanese-like domain-containing protein [Flavihumibacter profundi]|uniref:rhodanese-like domain-containing protein n=1 Tax=Flavihumibacter profundi TaxID=2716883 RepID=UPI001CC4FA1A|nr:rhodanese-like domain-containing protein [Flavihumibacter profundi]MBZ5859401.1 rhodanese-like domain-containing protein [Flavihumibacter profundi]